MNASSLIHSLGSGGHSAHVSMQLLVNGFSIAVLQMGEDFLLVERPVNHPPAVASVVMRVDENERRWMVNLPDGISTATKRVAITAA